MRTGVFLKRRGPYPASALSQQRLHTLMSSNDPRGRPRGEDTEGSDVDGAGDCAPAGGLGATVVTGGKGGPTGAIRTG